MSKSNTELMRKIILGVCVGISVFLVTDFVLMRRAQGECNVRQDEEIRSLRRDMTRMDSSLSDLRALSIEILKEVRK